MNYGKKGVRKKQKALSQSSTKWGKKFFLTLIKVILVLMLALGIVGASAGIGIFKGILSCAPSISSVSVTPTGFSTFAYDSQGNQIAKLVAADSNRIPVPWEKIPEDLAHAFVALEDERFYEHNGIDIKGIMRAGMSAIKNKGLSQGASTITQQLLKNSVFEGWTKETTVEKIKRKIQEQYLAIELEKTMSKEDILLNYMNTINLGQNTLGVQAASLRYFNKQVYQLTLSECAVIAAITQNPTKYNPISRPEENIKRRDTCLSYMLKQGYITSSEYDEAMADDVYSRIQLANVDAEDSAINTYFVDALTEDVMEDLITVAGYNDTQAYNLLYTGGLSIYTTQDPNIQSICDEVFSNEDNYPANPKWYLNYELTIEKSNGQIENHSTEMFKAHFKEKQSTFNLIYATQDDAYAGIEEYKADIMEDGDDVVGEKVTLTPQPQVSITVEDQSTGYVVAMVGGRGPKEASRTLNRAANTTRQPGSTFKIVSTYAPALDSAGLTLATVQNDAPYNYANGRPVANWYGNKYKGLCSLRYGIEQSLNIVTVKTLTQITPQLGFDYLKNFGFTTLVASDERNGKTVSDIGQAMALGGITDGVTNLELNASYATIANGGTYIKPTLYSKVVDHDNNVILDNTHPETRQVIKETTAYMLTDAMVDVVTKGTGGSVNFGGMAIAGKTGTTSDYVDVWFAGYTPYYTATTWAGYDNNVNLVSSEKNLAKSLWKNVMSKIHTDLPNKSFTVPSGLVTATICSKSGKLPLPGSCDSTLKSEYFTEDTVPTTTCDVHYSGFICQYSQLPASDDCPFKVPGTVELIPSDNLTTPSSSATAFNSATDPLQTGTSTPANRCPHDAIFMSQPNIEAIINQLRLELYLNAQAALGGATPETPVTPPATTPTPTPPADTQDPAGAVPPSVPAE